MYTQTIAEKIKQRRRQMLVHSYLYYNKDVNIVSDAKWSQWAMELVKLQAEYPEESKRVEFADMFADWDGSSGAFLKFGEDIISCAERLYESSQKVKEKPKLVKPLVKKSKSNSIPLF